MYIYDAQTPASLFPSLVATTDTQSFLTANLYVVRCRVSDIS